MKTPRTKRKPDIRSPEAAEYRKWYSRKIWKVRRKEQLAREPNCRRCKVRGRIKRASVANHIIPHRGDWDLFIGGELESLCFNCHDSTTQADEDRGFRRAPGASGWPADPAHPFNRPSKGALK